MNLIEIESLEKDSKLGSSVVDPKNLFDGGRGDEKINPSYVPKASWNDIVEENGLVVGDFVQMV